MSKRFVVLALFAFVFISSVFASAFSLYMTGSYLWSYDTNVFSNPMVKNATTNSAWQQIRKIDPYIKRFNNGFKLTSDMFFSKEGRTGLSISFDIGFPYKATEYEPDTEDLNNSNWEYKSKDALDKQKTSIFFGLGPAFRVILGRVDIALALRFSLGSYDYFDNNVIFGIQADPYVNVFISEDIYMTAGLHYDAHLMYFYLSGDEIYLPNYIKLTAGAFVGVGYKFGSERETNV